MHCCCNRTIHIDDAFTPLRVPHSVTGVSVLRFCLTLKIVLPAM